MNQGGPRLPAVYTLVRLDTVDSTMAEARRRAREGEEAAPEGLLIWAGEQTAGRGRRGRGWESPPGNLYTSLLLRPEVPLREAAQLGFVASVAVFDACARVADPGYDFRCKWPNDILLFDKKVAGLLLESEGGGDDAPPDFVVLGMGVNLQKFPTEQAEGAYPATSFAEQALEVAPETFLEAYATSFLEWVSRWVDDGFAPIRENWLWRAKGIGEPIQVRLERETLEGTFKDLDDNGALLLDQGEAGVRTVMAGDVFFAGPAMEG